MNDKEPDIIEKALDKMHEELGDKHEK